MKDFLNSFSEFFIHWIFNPWIIVVWAEEQRCQENMLCKLKLVFDSCGVMLEYVHWNSRRNDNTIVSLRQYLCMLAVSYAHKTEEKNVKKIA